MLLRCSIGGFPLLEQAPNRTPMYHNYHMSLREFGQAYIFGPDQTYADLASVRRLASSRQVAGPYRCHPGHDRAIMDASGWINSKGRTCYNGSNIPILW